MKNGHSTILFALTRIFTRLLLILTEAHDYVVLGSWYWCVIFTHKFFGFNWGQSYLATPQNFPKCFIFFNTLHIFASDQIKEEGNKIFFFLATFVTKSNFWLCFCKFSATFGGITGNFLRNVEKLVESPSLSLVFGTFKFRWSGDKTRSYKSSFCVRVSDPTKKKHSSKRCVIILSHSDTLNPYLTTPKSFFFFSAFFGNICAFVSSVRCLHNLFIFYIEWEI